MASVSIHLHLNEDDTVPLGRVKLLHYDNGRVSLVMYAANEVVIHGPGFDVNSAKWARDLAAKLNAAADELDPASVKVVAAA